MLRKLHSPRRERGFTLIEIMVGLVIGMLAVLVTYQIFNVSESFRRNTTAVADAQQNGLLSSFLMSLQLANASNGIASAGVSLDACPFDATAPDLQIKTTLRPIPVMITDSGDDNQPDKFVVNYGSTSRVVIPVEFDSKTVAGIDPSASYSVQSPTGFSVGDTVVLIDAGPNSGHGYCGSTKVTGVTPTDTASIIAAEGYVTLQHGGFTGTAGPCSVPVGGAYCGDSVLLNLGPTPQRIQYDIDTTTNTLHSTDLLNPLAVAQPVASNIVNMKVQYGIDSDNDGFVDKWIKAVNSPPYGDFSPAGILQMSYQDLSRIKAIRIALIVKSEQFDKTLGAWSPNPPVFGSCDGYASCPATPAISIPASTSPPGNYRYRSYETIVPLRNAIWNKDLS